MFKVFCVFIRIFFSFLSPSTLNIALVNSGSIPCAPISASGSSRNGWTWSGLIDYRLHYKNIFGQWYTDCCIFYFFRSDSKTGIIHFYLFTFCGCNFILLYYTPLVSNAKIPTFSRPSHVRAAGSIAARANTNPACLRNAVSNFFIRIESKKITVVTFCVGGGEKKNKKLK